MIAGGAFLGAVVTVATGGQPGNLLGVFLVAATLAAALAVRPQVAYLLIPVPALAYAVAAAAAGLAHGQAAGDSHTAIAVSAAQWIAGGFVTMAVATLVAAGVAAARRPRHGRDGSPRSRSRRAAGPGGPAWDQVPSASRGYRDRSYEDLYRTGRPRSGRSAR